MTIPQITETHTRMTRLDQVKCIVIGMLIPIVPVVLLWLGGKLHL